MSAASAWMSDELDAIAAADELQIQSLRHDGTLRSPVTIWVVRYGDDLYVRSVRGRTSAWFRGTQERREGHMQSGEVEKGVIFEEADPALSEQLDAAYRTKYRRYSKSDITSVITLQARAATLRLVPRS